ncbi:MAG: MOSC N-terminal beta barrel domain-containing protein [Actinomycetota bacterium]
MTSDGGATAGTLSAIHVYPIKSCRAVALDRAEVTRRGLAGDRLFQVVDEQTAPVTQRQEPKLATVQPTVIDGGLRLDADGRSPLEIATPTTNDTTATSLLGLPVDAADAGDDAAAWFADLLGAPVRLVGVTDETDHVVPFPDGEMHLGWADGSSVLVANSASHRWLAERADEPFGMDRFRPNLTVDADPWVEDTWRELSVGAARLGVGLAWPRCAIPQVDQVDGSRHREPAKVLKAHRWCADASNGPEALRPLLEGNALFGIGCSVERAGVEVAVGDQVVVHHTGIRVIDGPASD